MSIYIDTIADVFGRIPGVRVLFYNLQYTYQFHKHLSPPSSSLAQQLENQCACVFWKSLQLYCSLEHRYVLIQCSQDPYCDTCVDVFSSFWLVVVCCVNELARHFARTFLYDGEKLTFQEPLALSKCF